MYCLLDSASLYSVRGCLSRVATRRSRVYTHNAHGRRRLTLEYPSMVTITYTTHAACHCRCDSYTEGQPAARRTRMRAGLPSRPSGAARDRRARRPPHTLSLCLISSIIQPSNIASKPSFNIYLSHRKN